MRRDDGAGMAPLTSRLIELIRQREVTQADLDLAALFTLDAVASIVGGRSTEPGRILLEWWKGSGASPDDPGRLALLMGALCHILEIDDLHRESVVHPGCAVVPAVLAMARKEPKVSDGPACLAAILHGFEAACRLGAAVGRGHYKIWHNTATCGPFGSAFATATLLRLNDEQAAHALGNAGTQAAGLWQFLDTGAMSKHLHAGRAAEAGLVAATMAGYGFTGAPEILEGNRGFFRAMCPDGEPARILAEADAPWQLALTSIKPWPCCRHTHPAIDAAEELRDRMAAAGITAGAIEAVDIEGYQAALDLCDRPAPRTAYDAKFSLQHTVAAALSSDSVWFESFEADARMELEHLRQRISVRVAAELEASYPRRWGARITVRADGRIFAAEREAALGDPELALTKDRLIDKARRLLLLGGHRQPDSLIDDILGMAAGGPGPDIAREIFFPEDARLEHSLPAA